jgi:transposase
MERWAAAPELRDQISLFPQYLDEAIGADHIVRFLDEALNLMDWSSWEAKYHPRLGQPAIHPRILAGVLIYGLITRIRSSRALEEALVIRLDFRWLVSGRTIDHTTLSEFRRNHRESLRDLFVQVALLARQMNQLKLERLAFDGTRVLANNRRSGTRTPAQLQRLKAELTAKYDREESEACQKDAQDEEVLGLLHAEPAAAQTDPTVRLERLRAALAELERIEQAGEQLPSRLPITDPESRVMPNKNGGFAPNYTPTATVDMSSGLVVNADVINAHNEDSQLLPTLQQVQSDFQLEALPPEVVADGLMGTGANLAACSENKVILYSPSKLQDSSQNPALREDLNAPVPTELLDQLPVACVNVKGEKAEVFHKSAFVYDSERDCYQCPQGQALHYQNTTSEKNRSGQRERDRYQCDQEICASCPLRARCVHPRNEGGRTISREQHEAHREAHAQRMATPEAQSIYRQRRHFGERPFAVIKQQFGLRQFLLRGLEAVQCEWQWATIAFNIQRLFQLTKAPSVTAAPPAPPP